MATILTAIWLWQTYDRALTSWRMRNYKPPVPATKPAYPTQCVSILIVTIDTPDEFTATLRMCLANKPKEIIVVTIPRDLERVQKLAAPVKDEATVPIMILTVPKPGRRTQMALCVKEATGDVVCFVDDDTIWPTDKVLPYLLAPFEDPKVGAVVGKQSAWIPKERRDASVITPWEVAGLRKLVTNNEKQLYLHATCDDIWCLTGRSMMVRTDVMKPGDFLHEWTHELWAGQIIMTGEDSFLTRWMRAKGWKLFHQDAPEAEVFTDVKRDSNFVGQLIRWRRNGFQAFAHQLFYEPGFWAIYKQQPYFARKLFEEFARPLITIIHLIGWIWCILTAPRIALVFALWYLVQNVKTYRAFLAEYPWIGLSNLYAAVAMDYFYLWLDYYGMITINKEGWLTRNDK